MKNKIIIKCSNCSGTEFMHTSIGEILEGHFNVNAYACKNCGHIELFDPKLDLYAKQERAEYEERKMREEAERKNREEVRQKRIKELQEIINNEDMTVRQVNEAKKELEALCNGSRFNVIEPIGNRRDARPDDYLRNKGIHIIEEK